MLSIDNLVFKLRDDFKGGLSAALRSLARYHETHPRLMKSKRGPGGRLSRKTWASFQEIVGNGGRLACKVSVQKFDSKKRQWRKMKL